jgi:hypothetical protein
MKSICPIHESDYSGKTRSEIQSIRVCKKCAKQLETEIPKEILNEN